MNMDLDYDFDFKTHFRFYNLLGFWKAFSIFNKWQKVKNFKKGIDKM